MMKTKTLTLPSLYASAIVNMDYSGLDKQDIKTLNNELLNNDVLFCDCLTVGDEYITLMSGSYCMVADYVFKMSV